MFITDNAKKIADSCRFCWMCRHICPIGNATGQERNTARARALGVSLVAREATTLDEISDNIYECALCGACTNNCLTGWDPKVFVREVRTQLVLEGKTPEYINKLIKNYIDCGNVYGKEVCDCIKEDLKAVNSDTLIFLGDDAVVKSPTSVKKVKKILDIAGVSYTFNEKNDSGSVLYFLAGKTNEVVETAKKTAELMNNYKTVVVYDPVDLSMILHEYKEWGIEVTAKIIGFNEYLLSLIESGSLKVKKGSVEYTLQDNYAYARELDDVNYGRKLIEKVGVVKDVLLIRKEANLAGNLIMNEYMPDVMKIVASNRLEEAKRMGCKVIVTENPAEYEILKANLKEGIRVISIEEMLLENV